MTPCFEESDELVLTAEWTNPDVIVAVVFGDSIVRVQGLSPGTSTVTVVATDPDMMSGQQGFNVLVPNRPPQSTGVIPGTTLVEGGTAQWILSQYFSDPDEQELSYAATAPDDEVASPSVSGDILTVKGLGVGTVAVSVVASDPGGLNVTQDVSVEVSKPFSLFRDNFDSRTSLDDWKALAADLAVLVEGKLRVTTEQRNSMGFATKRLRATDWKVEVSMGNVSEDSWVQLVVETGHEQFRAYMLQIGIDSVGAFGDDTNYRLQVWDERAGWIVVAGASGVSELVKDVGELVDVSLSVQSDTLSVTLGGTEVFSADLGRYPNRMTKLLLGVYPLPSTVGKVGVFDWVEVFGVPGSGVTADGHSVERGVGVAGGGAIPTPQPSRIPRRPDDRPHPVGRAGVSPEASTAKDTQ